MIDAIYCLANKNPEVVSIAVCNKGICQVEDDGFELSAVWSKMVTSIDNSNRYFILSFIFIRALKSDIIECKGHHSVLLSMCFLYVHCFKYNAFSNMWFRKSTVMGKFYCSFYHYFYLSNFISASINPLPSYFKGIHLKVLMLIPMPSLFLFVTIFCCLHFQKE